MKSAQDKDREQEQKIGVLEGRTEELKSSAESLQRECEELRAALKEKEVTGAAANSRVEMLSAELSTKVSGWWMARDNGWIEKCTVFGNLLYEMECSLLLPCLGTSHQSLRRHMFCVILCNASSTYIREGIIWLCYLCVQW